MTQYDAGPGDWTDRDWESPDRKPKPQAKRRFTLPPWALIAITAAVAILLCVAAVLVVRALRGGSTTEVPTVLPTFTAVLVAPTAGSATEPAVLSTAELSATATVELPAAATAAPPTYTSIGPGATVVVQGTRGVGLNVRAAPSTNAKIVGSAKEGTELLVLEGPTEADGHTWWKVRLPDGKEGWAAGEYLVLKQ